MGDAGCMPHTLPGMPESWPWESSREAIDGLFLQEFANNGCFECHASTAQTAQVVFPRVAPPGPLMPPYDTEYEQAKNNLWAVLTTSEPATFDTANPVGRLWFHHPNFVVMNGEDNDPIYDRDEQGTLVTRMNRLLLRAQACNNTKYAQMPADAGPNCGDGTGGGPRDAGPMTESDGGGVDGGAVDAGGGGGGGESTGLCYCELGDLGYTPDLLLYCAE